MSICNSIQQKLNSAALLGYSSVIIEPQEIKYTELETIKDCGFHIEERKDSEDGLYYIISK